MANLKAYKGDTNVYDISVVRQNAPVNLGGAKMWFTAKLNIEDTDAQAKIKLDSATNPTQVIFTQALQGRAQVILRPVDTNTLVEDALYYDIQIVEQSGVVTTIASGVLHLEDQVTVTFA